MTREAKMLAVVEAAREWASAYEKNSATWSHVEDVNAALAALSEAERVVRENEREAYEVKQDKATLDTLNWCLNWLNVRANADKVLANAEAAFCARRDALQRDIDEHRAAIRARGAA